MPRLSGSRYARVMGINCPQSMWLDYCVTSAMVRMNALFLLRLLDFVVLSKSIYKVI